MDLNRIGIVGCGTMGSAMAERWITTGTVQREQIVACTATPDGSRKVMDQLGILCGTSCLAVVEAADVVVLGVKPQHLDALLPSLGMHARPGQVWLSILAGVTTARLEAGLPSSTQVVRCMPNTPSRLGLGIVAVAPGTHASPEAVARVRQLVEPLGLALDLPEHRMDAFTSVAGSGPAYVFLFLEVLARAAQAEGFEPDLARELALRVLLGAGELARVDGRDPAKLRAEVTSRRGVTEAALSVLAEAGWADTMVKAVATGRLRSSELAGNTPTRHSASEILQYMERR